MPQIDPYQVGTSILSAFEAGQAQREKREMRQALSVFSTNPDDPRALGAVIERDPKLGMQLAEFQDKRAFQSALGDYLGDSRQMLGVSTSAPVAPRAGNITVPLAGGNATPAAPAPVGEATPAEPQADWSFLGQPKSGRDEAFLRMVQRDPIQALKIQSTLRDNFMDRLEAESDFYTIAIEELSSATDDAAWQRGLQRLAPSAAALGASLAEKVPTTYPGPEAVRQMLESALPVKERLDYFMREANMLADNERADRNTDSMIETREQRVRDQRVLGEGRLANQRRGQDLGDARGRRGQDLTDARGRRGQDISASRPRGGKAGKPVPTATGANGEKYELRGGKWVQIK